MVRRSVMLELPEMTGNAGEILRQAAGLASAGSTIPGSTSPLTLRICQTTRSGGARRRGWRHAPSDSI